MPAEYEPHTAPPRGLPEQTFYFAADSIAPEVTSSGGFLEKDKSFQTMT